MSESSFDDQSYRTTSHHNDGGSPSSDGSSFGESTESGKIEAWAREKESSSQTAPSRKYNDNVKAFDSAPAPEDRTTSTTRQLRSPDRTYVDLLNESIVQARGQNRVASEALGPSQIGASYWTSKEKELLFRTLAVHGIGDLQALSQSIGTKSKAEIHVYLSLLQNGVEEVTATFPNPRQFSPVEIPSAFEISAECEEALQLQADELTEKLAKQDARSEQNRYNDVWLIDGDYASEIEQRLETQSKENLLDNQNSATEGDDHASESHQHSPGLLSSAKLLRPEAFIQLAENIFMAGIPGDQNRWYDSDQSLDSVNGPAIYRTAFDEFHSLAVSLTRRLIQATLFQTMTRLRSGDTARTDWKPQPEVTRVDVTTALDILGIDAEGWMKYWARLPRKAGLHVYTDSKKYRDGRPSTKNGVKLSYDEVEAELGLSAPNFVLRKEEEEDDDDAEFDPSELVSEDFTEVTNESCPSEEGMLLNENEPVDFEEIEQSHCSDIADLTNRNASEDQLDMELEKASPGTLNGNAEGWDPRKRKRPMSQSSLTKVEDRYMEVLDLASSKREEKWLWDEIIQKKPPKVVDSISLDKPERPRGKFVSAVETLNWRKRVQYEAEWERVEQPIADSSFVDIGQVGEFRKKKRRKLKEITLMNDVAPPDCYHHGANLQNHLIGSTSPGGEETEPNDPDSDNDG
ncbi:hypothetical protein M433DRAFT_133347 [Acidomyces richmondensis BFW]|nr:hypothetical protein M433DRAFT_133347 [Acidomyces richmondensis BFW]